MQLQSPSQRPSAFFSCPQCQSKFSCASSSFSSKHSPDMPLHSEVRGCPAASGIGARTLVVPGGWRSFIPLAFAVIPFFAVFHMLRKNLSQKRQVGAAKRAKWGSLLGFRAGLGLGGLGGLRGLGGLGGPWAPSESLRLLAVLVDVAVGCKDYLFRIVRF